MSRFERSCGVVIFHERAGVREYLLLHYPTGHWDFAKGHVEEGESDMVCALRETKEETGITTLTIVEGFQHEFEYMYRNRHVLVRKKVTWFLGRAPSNAVVISHEHRGFAWLPFEKAVERVTYDNAKDLLRKAESFLNEQAAQATDSATG